jgi:transcriptional regulator with XRE-family HTH domain
MSNIQDDLGAAIAAKIQAEREIRGWSLGDLADHSGVSKAMLSKIERAEASPTAATLSRVATALGLTLAALVAEQKNSRLARANEQPVWHDPKTSYRRRQIFLSPANPLELVEIELPPLQEVHFPAGSYLLIRQVVWVLHGRLTIVEGTQRHVLNAGDRLEFGAPADCTFRNEGAPKCSYLVAVVRR